MPNLKSIEQVARRSICSTSFLVIGPPRVRPMRLRRVFGLRPRLISRVFCSTAIDCQSIRSRRARVPEGTARETLLPSSKTRTPGLMRSEA